MSKNVEFMEEKDEDFGFGLILSVMIIQQSTPQTVASRSAVYEAFQAEGVGPEKAAWYIREYFQCFSAKTVPHLQRIIKVVGLARKIPKLFMKISVKSFGTDAGFEYEFPESHGNEARFNIVHCPYYETCNRYGCPEITTAFCDGDDAGYGNLHPNLIWGRTKTIGRGDECCNFLLKYRD